MRTLITVVGSREIDEDYVWDELQHVLRKHDWMPGNSIIVSGGASTGGDKVAKEYAHNYGYRFIEIPANWDLYGKSAGFLRNEALAAMDVVIAFWDYKSKGTKHTIDLAIERKKRLFVNGDEFNYGNS